jgi:hypothetical protein
MTGDLPDTNLSVGFFIQALKAYPYHIFLGLALLRLLYNKYGRGVSRIPGPALAAWTGLWRLIDVSKGDAHNTAIALHRKHGKLVRIGPRHVSVSDPAAIQTIYGLKSGFTKVRRNRLQSPIAIFLMLMAHGRRRSIRSIASAGTRSRR